MHGFPEVLAAARVGQAWAFRALYEHYAPRVHGYVRGKGVAEPDEVTNDVFAQALTALGRFVGDEAGFRTWLFTIAHRRVIDSYRRSANQPQPVPYELAADVREAPSAEADALVGLREHVVRHLVAQNLG